MASFPNRLVFSARRRLDRLFAEPLNRRLERHYNERREAMLDAMEAAAARGTNWFDRHEDLTMSALFVMEIARRITGLDCFDLVHDRARIYREKFYDPGLRIVFPEYDRRAHSHRPPVTDVRPYQVIELVMIDAMWSDRGDAERVYEYLKALRDGGHYGSTHTMVGAMLMKNCGLDLDGRLDALLEEQAPLVAAANHGTSFAGDLFAERIFILEWSGRHDLVSPAWLMRVVSAQRPDGGWSGWNVPPEGESNQHTTSLAAAALAMFVAAERRSVARQDRTLRQPDPARNLPTDRHALS